MTNTVEEHIEKILDSLLDKDRIKSLLPYKKNAYDFKQISKNQLIENQQLGWEIYKVNKASFRMKKLKPFDRAFEDRVWAMFASMGYNSMNQDRNFRLNYNENLSIPGKQIDVFA